MDAMDELKEIIRAQILICPCKMERILIDYEISKKIEQREFKRKIINERIQNLKGRLSYLKRENHNQILH